MTAPGGVFVHPRGLCESADVGPGTRIWAFAHVLPGAKVSPEIAAARSGGDTMRGIVYALAGTALAAGGNVAAVRNQKAGIPIFPGTAWGMLYGALFSLAVTLATGQALAFEWTVAYVASLLYLTILGSIVAFGAFLTLLNRIGAARSGYIGVMVPIVALVISAFFEGFSWHALTWLGIAISVAGNVLVLRR